MKKLLTLILSLGLYLLPISSSRAETIIIPIQDLIHEIPNFAPPKIDLNSILNGQGINIENPPKTKRERREMERKLCNIIYEFCPDVENIRIWNGYAIIKFLDEPTQT